jgi:hypothetical protein
MKCISIARGMIRTNLFFDGIKKIVLQESIKFLIILL